MGKSLINTKQWTSNDIRLLVIAHFVIVYPVLAGSLFMVMLFFVIPPPSIWIKAYWLIVSGAWMLLLAVVLPLMGSPNEYYPTGTQRRPKKKEKSYGSTEKIPMAQDIRVEAAKMDRINRDSVLTNQLSQKSESSSSDDSIDKGTLEEKADKENREKLQGSLNISRDSLQKSMDSVCTNETLNEKRALTQSGEFLNDCIGKRGDVETDVETDTEDDEPNDDNLKSCDSGVDKEKTKKKVDDIDDKKYDTANTLEKDNKQEVVAVVHLQTYSPDKESKDDSLTDSENDSTEKVSKDDDSDIEMINESNDLNGKHEEEGKPLLNNDKNNELDDTQNIDGKAEKIDNQINKTFIVTPTPKDVIDKQLRQEAVMVDDDEEEEELGELLPPLSQRRNQDYPLNVDTSLANETIVENTVSTPISGNSLSRRGSNVVHLFIQGN